MNRDVFMQIIDDQVGQIEGEIDQKQEEEFLVWIGEQIMMLLVNLGNLKVEVIFRGK